MSDWITQLAMSSNGRAFTADEAEKIAQSVESLPDRIAAVQAVEQQQKWLTRIMTEHLSPIAQEWGLPKDPLAHDFVVGLSTLCNAALCDDHDLIQVRVVKPYCRLARALEVSSSIFGTMLKTATEGLQAKLGHEAFQPLQPYFQVAIDRLMEESNTSDGADYSESDLYQTEKVTA
jgi:hypothetical protein